MRPELLQFLINSYEQDFSRKPVEIKLDPKSYTLMRDILVTSKFHGGRIFADRFYFNNILVTSFRLENVGRFKIEINSDPNPLKAL